MTDRPTAIDMALDDAIKQNRGGRARKNDVQRPNRPPRRRSIERATFTVRNDRPVHNRTEDLEGRILISNLFHEVTKEDLKELFSQVGTVKNVHIDYDRAGRSNGTAKVVFSSKRDALVASDRFHHMPLDGCPMQIEILSSSAHQERGSFRVHDRHRNTPQNMGIRKAAFKSRNTHEPSRQGTRSRAPTGRSTPTNAAALDAELDNYMMQQ